LSVQCVVSSSGSLSLPSHLTSLDDHGPSFGGPLIINPISSLRTLHAMSPRNQQCVEVFEQTHMVTRYLRVKRVIWIGNFVEIFPISDRIQQESRYRHIRFG